MEQSISNHPNYAHSLPGQPPEKWQTLDDHLRSVAEKARDFASTFGSEDWAYNAGLLHDLGKASDAFQAYLRRENGLDDSEYDGAECGRTNHSGAGAALAENYFNQLRSRILAYLVAGHHAGLPDWYPADTGRAALQCRLQEGKELLSSVSSQAMAVVLSHLHPDIKPPSHVKRDSCHLWVRLLFSCLVDADFLNTEAFMQPEQAGQRSIVLEIPQLKNLFDQHMTDLEQQSCHAPINVIRREVLNACRDAAKQVPGLFSLTVPTGGGKTLSGMAFALDHAVLYKKTRIIYLIPYTSIIEQTAGVLKSIFGPDNIVEHHSNLDPEKETQRSRLASENWDAPIVVTTNVQFFESLYSAKSSRCRKLHNIVNSVVILDEAQLLPPELITPCVDVINQLVRNYGVTVLLSTATQPALPNLARPREIIPDPTGLYARLKRTEITMPASLHNTSSWDDIAQQLQQHEQVLCIVNTRRDCYDLFRLMPEGTIHLSALMCGAHRSDVIQNIKQRLKDRLPVRVISTQLVETGVDIDFPVVYRALSGLPSIVQAAGRCNREGLLSDKGYLGQVNVFIPPKPSPRGLLLKGENTTRELCTLSDFNPDAPSFYTRYFELFYPRVNDTGSRFNDWLIKDASCLKFQFRTAGKEFRFIDDREQCPVIVRFGQSPELLKRLHFEGPTRDLMRQFQRYTVNLHRRMADAMLANGFLEEVDKKKAPGIIAQSNLKVYDKSIGLDVYREHLPVEDLMV